LALFFTLKGIDRMQIAVRLEPDVAVRQAGQMLFAMMIGLGDSIGALAPLKLLSPINCRAM